MPVSASQLRANTAERKDEIMEFMFASARKHDDKNEEQKKLLQVWKVENLIEKTMCSTMPAFVPAHFSIVFLSPFEQEIIIVRRLDHSCNLECSFLPNNVSRCMAVFIIILCAHFFLFYFRARSQFRHPVCQPSKFRRFDRSRECIQ